MNRKRLKNMIRDVKKDKHLSLFLVSAYEKYTIRAMEKRAEEDIKFMTELSQKIIQELFGE
jgi:hypothetical protein